MNKQVAVKADHPRSRDDCTLIPTCYRHRSPQWCWFDARKKKKKSIILSLMLEDVGVFFFLVTPVLMCTIHLPFKAETVTMAIKILLAKEQRFALPL